jgi:hypothetical protein
MLHGESNVKLDTDVPVKGMNRGDLRCSGILRIVEW